MKRVSQSTESNSGRGENSLKSLCYVVLQLPITSECSERKATQASYLLMHSPSTTCSKCLGCETMFCRQCYFWISEDWVSRDCYLEPPYADFLLHFFSCSNRWKQWVWKWHWGKTKRWEHKTNNNVKHTHIKPQLLHCGLIVFGMTQLTVSGWCWSNPCWGRQAGTARWSGIWWNYKRGNCSSIS